MLTMFNDDVRRNPFGLLNQMRTVSPVLQVPETEIWMLFDHASVKRALVDQQAFSSAVTPPGGRAPDWLIFSDAPKHTKLKNLILRAFTKAAIARLEPIICRLSKDLLKPAISCGEFDLVNDFAAPLPAMVIAEMLGIPLENRDDYLRWAGTILKLGDALADSATAEAAYAENARVKEEMREYLLTALETRRGQGGSDLLSRLQTAEVDGVSLTENEILGFFQLLLLAGIETTTNTISNAIICLLDHPLQLERLRAAPELMAHAVEEVLRYRTPVQFVFRETRMDVEMHGKLIPSGQLVLPMTGSANRDPNQFEDPERFDIGRSPVPHLAFGHGIHFCLGAALARLEARIALSLLLERTRDLRLVEGHCWEPLGALNVHGPKRLLIQVS